MSIQVKKVMRYSISFKKQVVSDVEGGLSISDAMRRYGINGGQTVQKWMRTFGKGHLLNQVIRIETMDEKARLKQLEEEVKKLKIALADSMLAQRCLEEVIVEANKEYKTDLKKNFGDASSTSSGKNTV